MIIVIIVSAATNARTGNHRAAMRYAECLRADGHRVRVGEGRDGGRTDVLVALHARKSFDSMTQYRGAHSCGALVLVLTGTKLYRDIRSDKNARAALVLADRLIVLQNLGVVELPAQARAKARVVYQYARAAHPAERPKDRFRFAVIGHLREEKDPFLAALALAHVGTEVGVEFVHVGDALDPSMAREARRLMRIDSRYRRGGGAIHTRTLRCLASSHALVLASKVEGGANVICEATRAGAPVLASRVSGDVGILGRGYPGCFRLGAERALARLIVRTARDTAFRRRLERAIRPRGRLFTPESEYRGVMRAISEAFSAPRVGPPKRAPAARRTRVR